MRKSFGAKSIAENAGAELVAKGREVEDFFRVSGLEMEVKRSIITVGKNRKNVKKVETHMVVKDVVHVENTSVYLNHLLKLRALNPKTTFIRVGMDGGGGSVKVLLSIFNPADIATASLNWEKVEIEDSTIEGMV